MEEGGYPGDPAGSSGAFPRFRLSGASYFMLRRKRRRQPGSAGSTALMSRRFIAITAGSGKVVFQVSAPILISELPPEQRINVILDILAISRRQPDNDNYRTGYKNSFIMSIQGIAFYGAESRHGNGKYELF